MEKQYFTTGEFAKLCGVSKQTLIFYDKIGIFSPEYKDKNNYRYYSVYQYDTLDILQSLREIGMSLEEIKEYIKNRSPQHCVEMLKEEEKKIKEKIKKLKQISSKIQNRINTTVEGISKIYNEEIYISNRCEEYLVLSSDLSSINDGNFMMELIDFTNYCKSKNLYQGYELGAIVSNENIKNGEYLSISSFYLKIDKKIKDKKLYIKPEGMYVCIKHIGRYEDSYKSYEKLKKYIYDNNYKIIGNSYEESILDFFCENKEENYMTEISIQISI
ncbi:MULTISPECIES: MerR family transcriptional regulator [unclassified Clostridioides]|uniref:MerR family transcriptional regulator n=1 Tax=unclassified Clostridioides TaxID=2635829 RepID=UPI001D0F7CE0|nr:MerR family transcriptional regulator [Clostridioides sp. ES-S-0049-03]MCC0674576.1 MerR family transcriptional regulator [Clostridioides sp. ES-W-0018-02]MCC0710608.1 MerR family transcriptional regulator [Clostridioides sp. ES-W-0017-02]